MSIFRFLALAAAAHVCCFADVSITASAGPGTSLVSDSSVAVMATVSSNVTLSFAAMDSRYSGFAASCTPGKGSCQGSLADTASLNGNYVSNAGTYKIDSTGVTLNVAPTASCGAAATCTFTLPPGQYILSAKVSDSFTGVGGGVPSAFTESFTATLTVNSGNVVAVPGTSTPTIPYPVPVPDPTTCPIANGLKSFILEDLLFPSSFQTAFIPTLAASTFAALIDPTKEVHTHFTFDTTSMIFRADSIPLPLGSPAISPSTTDFAGQSIATVIVKVDKVYAICSPRPTIMVTGPITGGSQVFGSLVGVPHGFSFSFDPTNTSNINNAANVTISDAGANTVVSLVASAIVTGASTTASVNGGPAIKTFYKETVLDGTPSKSGSGPLTYQWSVKGPGVVILDPTASQTRIRIDGDRGRYPVTLTVTSATGETSTANVDVHFIGQ